MYGMSMGGWSIVLGYFSPQLFFEEVIHLALCVPVPLCVIRSTTVVRE